jgi:hypothetical protein
MVGMGYSNLLPEIQIYCARNEDSRKSGCPKSRFLIKTDSTSLISLRLDHGLPQKKFPGMLHEFQVTSETQLEWKGRIACSIKQ